MLKPVAFVVLLAGCLGLAFAVQTGPQKVDYIRKNTRARTLLASLKANGLPTLEGKWLYIGPFENAGEDALETAHPPEKETDLKKTYTGKGGRKVGWKEFADFKIGEVNDVAKFKPNNHSFIYLYHEFEVRDALSLPVSLGSDDSLAIWLNGVKVFANNAVRSAAPDQDQATLKLSAGKNRLLLRVGNLDGGFEVYICPEVPAFAGKLLNKLNRDFPGQSPTGSKAQISAEAKYYRIVTVPVPQDIVLEVGGLAFRPDGKLLACTRRGEVWLITPADSDEPKKIELKLFANGLHEPLGLHVDGKDVYVVQRPELTKLVDRDGDDVADEYITVCDKWSVSGDYHEFAFGPARDRQGNFFVTLNVGFGGGHQSRGPWRGWCVKITPKGELIPWAAGLRSPNGIAFNPDGDLFYCDNQGEWVATNKMHHIRQGEFYGHQAALRWLSQSPFAKSIAQKQRHGMLYDGQPGKDGVPGMPGHAPPCIWFPYGRMGQSVTEPRWDTSGGKFGPFAGQCFVGDQTKSIVMRVALEKINDKYQGACFPFRSGLQCGVNRSAFGPDSSMYCGQTNRGWGSVGGKPYGLERLVWTGDAPFEILTMKLTKTGFDLTFTKPLDMATARKLEAYNLQSFTYNYWPTYGSPEVNRTAEKLQAVQLTRDPRTVSLTVLGLRRGRVYELNLDGLRSKDGDSVLHPEAYYTLNELP